MRLVTPGVIAGIPTDWIVLAVGPIEPDALDALGFAGSLRVKGQPAKRQGYRDIRLVYGNGASSRNGDGSGNRGLVDRKRARHWIIGIGAVSSRKRLASHRDGDFLRQQAAVGRSQPSGILRALRDVANPIVGREVAEIFGDLAVDGTVIGDNAIVHDNAVVVHGAVVGQGHTFCHSEARVFWDGQGLSTLDCKILRQNLVFVDGTGSAQEDDAAPLVPLRLFPDGADKDDGTPILSCGDAAMIV